MSRTEAAASPPESYVVRIYRRNASMPGRVAGTVEVVGSGNQLSFRSMRELQRILAGQGGRASNPLIS